MRCLYKVFILSLSLSVCMCVCVSLLMCVCVCPGPYTYFHSAGNLMECEVEDVRRHYLIPSLSWTQPLTSHHKENLLYPVKYYSDNL